MNFLKFETAKPIRLLSGLVKLSKKQVALRKLHLEPEDGSQTLMRVTRPDEFKAGELIQFPADQVPKGLLPDLIDKNPKPKTENEGAGNGAGNGSGDDDNTGGEGGQGNSES